MGCGGIKTKHPLLSEDSKINIIFWSTNKESAIETSEFIIKGNKDPERYIWVKQETGLILNGYIRYPNTLAKETPKGICDVLIALLDSNSDDDIKECENYVTSRKDIPFKYLSGEGEEIEKLAKMLDVIFIDIEKLKSSVFRDEIIDNSKKMDLNLKNVFCNFDINQNGFISADELAKVSKKLKNPINLEEAQKIAFTIDPINGNIEYSKFKYWWTLGKDKFGLFRSAVKKQISMENLFLGSEALNKYMEKMKENQIEDKGLSFKMSFIPSTKFEVGSSLNVSFLLGENFKERLDNFSEKIKSCPISFGFEINVEKIQEIEKTKEMLESFKKTIFSIFPQIIDITEMGLDIQIITKQSCISIEFILSSNLADELFFVLSDLRFAELNVTANAVIELQTELKIPLDLIKFNFGELLSKLMNMKIETNIQSLKFVHFIESIKIFLKSFNHGYLPRNIKEFFKAIKILQIFSKSTNENIFEPQQIISYLKDLNRENEGSYGNNYNNESQEDGWEAISRKFNYYKTEFTKQYEEILKTYFKEYYLKYFTNINFDKLNAFVLIPVQNCLIKANLQLSGLTEFLENIMS